MIVWAGLTKFVLLCSFATNNFLGHRPLKPDGTADDYNWQSVRDANRYILPQSAAFESITKNEPYKSNCSACQAIHTASKHYLTL